MLTAIIVLLSLIFCTQLLQIGALGQIKDEVKNLPLMMVDKYGRN